MTAATSRLRRRSIGAGVAALVGLTGLGFAAVPAQAAAGFDPAASQVSGTDRFDTAARIATSAFPGGSDTVVVANGDRAIDAQAGAYAAGLNKAPILLTQKSSVPTFTVNAIKTLKATKAIVLGDANSVDETALAQMRAAGLTVTVVAGADRFETAADIYNLGSTKATTVFLARADLLAGQVSPDALAASPLSYNGTPVLLTNAGNLPTATADAIKAGGVKNVVVLGNAITDSVKTAVSALGATVTTIAGDDRSLTAQKIADYGMANNQYGNTAATIANGDKIDALAAGPWAALNKAPILLTLGTANLGTGTTGYLAAHSSTLTKATVFGDASSVPASLTSAAKTAGGGDVVAAPAARPTLTSASVVNTVTTAQATSSTPAGTRVKFTFSEALSTPAASIVAANFKLYNSDGTVVTTPSGAATVDSSGTSVTLNYQTLNTATLAAAVTRAGVVADTVLDTQNFGNTEGAASLGAAGSANLPAGITANPDLASVSNYRAGLQANTTIADFTFDQNAYLVGSDATAKATTVGNNVTLFLSDGTSVAGSFAGAVSDSGTTSPGGDGTAVISIQFANPTIGGTVTQLSASNVARAAVAAGTVARTSTTATAADQNVLQTVNVASTTRPDLVSVALRPGATSTDNDQALFTYDTPVSVSGTSTAFNLVKSDGTTVASTAATVNTSDRRQVLVTFATTTATVAAIGANVAAAAATGVQADGTAAPGNPASLVQWLSFAGTTTASAPGVTSAPDLTGVKISGVQDAFGATTYQVDYTFDQATTGSLTAANYKLYLADGTVLIGGAATRPTLSGDAANTVVRVTGFTAGGTAATAAQFTSAILGTTVAGAAGAASGSPEGSVAVTR